MSQFQDILDDEKTFPDNIELTINGKQVTLGDVRGLSRKKQQELTEKMADTERKRAEVLELATKAADLEAKLRQQLEDSGRPKPTPTEDEFDNDPFWAPVRKRLAGPQETIKKLDETVKTLTNQLSQAAAIWAEDRWHSQYERAKPRLKDKAKDWTYEKVRDYAAQNKLVDSFGLPSVEKAIMSLTQEDELQARVNEAYEKGLREGTTKGRMGVQPKPTSAAGPPRPEKSAVAEKGLEALGDDVQNDPELMNMLSELGAIDPGDLVQ